MVPWPLTQSKKAATRFGWNGLTEQFQRGISERPRRWPSQDHRWRPNLDQPGRDCGHVDSSASNASPIVITTSNTSNLSNGSIVTISGATSNTNANGTWIISHVTATGFTLAASTVNGNVSAGNGNYNIFSGGSWATSIEGDTINCVVPTTIIDPTTGKQVILVGTNGQGMWRSNDGGATFAPVGYGFFTTPNQYPNATVASIVADPTTPGRFYAALAGVGVFESVNGGLGWIEIDDSISQITSSGQGLQLGGRGQRRQYVPLRRHHDSGTTRVVRLRRRTRGGVGAVLTSSNPLAVSWQAIALQSVPSNATAGGSGHIFVLTDPTNPNVIYVSGWQQTLYRVNVTGEAADGKSLDGSWNPISAGGLGGSPRRPT